MSSLAHPKETTMKHSRRPAGFRLLAMSSLAACAGFAAPAFSQQQRQQPSRPARNAPAQPPSAAPSTGGGLNALNDDALIAELAGRGQESLLERAFEVNKTPPEQRAGLKALGALRELSNKQKPPTSSRRQALIAQVVAGSKAVLPTIKDPVRLMEVAALLITEGSDPLLNLLEYWGENPVTQARLRPIAETVVSLYEQAAAEAEAVKADVEKRISGPNDRANAERWTRLDELSQIATLTRHMT